jgi:outer membrane receptor protein involved in Fe transport
VALELVHQGRYWMDNANTVRYGGHSLLNLRANYRIGQGWEAWLQARNLADKHYADSASSSYSGVGVYTPNTQNQYTPGAPRSIMLGLSYTYGGKP